MVPRCKRCTKSAAQQYYEKNKEKLKLKQSKYYKENKDACNNRTRQYHHKNKDAASKKQKEYYHKNKKTINQYRNQYWKERRSLDPVVRLIHSLRSGLYKAVKCTGKNKTTLELLGCSPEHLKNHLTAQFTEGMTIDNYGEWHIDHIRPVASFDQADPAQLTICWHYTNLQPLWAEDNLKKSDTW